MMKPMFLSNHLVGWDPPVSRSAKPGEKSLGSVPLPGWRFHRACYRLCGGVRVWFDFVWCQRISAEIKIEIQSTSLNFGEKTGVQSLTKKGLHILICVALPQKVYYRVPGFTFWVGHSTIVHDRLCVPLPVGGVGSSRGTHPTHFPAALGFEVYPGTTGFNRLIGLIYSYNPLLNNYDWFQ